MDLHFEGKHDRPWPNRQLENAAIIGHTTATSIRLWLRTRQPGKYWVAVGLKTHPNRPDAKAGRDYKNVHADVALLERHGFIEREHRGLRVPFDEIHAGFVMRKAA